MVRNALGLSRFADDLPEVGEFVSLGEGDTPLVPLDKLARRLGVASLTAKLETVNPTGSYKDRVAAMSISLAKRRGQRGWVTTSSGNAGAAMAAYGARAGLPGFVCLVASAPKEKRLPLLPYPIGVAAVEGVGNRASGKSETGLFGHVRAAALRHDLYLATTAHAFNPDGMRGIDTLSYELAEQHPDATHVYVPTGGGGLLAAVSRGVLHRGMRARTIACQPTGCDPIARFLAGQLSEPAIDTCTSGISALQLPHPPDGLLAAELVRKCDGWGVSVPDEEILVAQRVLSEVEGVFVEPAAAAGLAALTADVHAGRVGGEDEPVLVLTGAGWKDLNRFAPDLARISPLGLDEVPAAIDAWHGGLD
ncbi:pyridoxal-phosphate dependent enzyme [Amycolatopsis dongchuanensis]|uniref:Threonine synthase n=1 Tax=Amycolatopsis dongchuanensis TaxID=1070866 RepID=A0ABP8VIZ6_9PSEU